jgi:hypothetical protein
MTAATIRTNFVKRLLKDNGVTAGVKVRSSGHQATYVFIEDQDLYPHTLATLVKRFGADRIYVSDSGFISIQHES